MYKIDKNLSLNEYFPKSIKTKTKDDKGKSYSDRTGRETYRKTNRKTIEIYKIDIKMKSKYKSFLKWIIYKSL